MSRTAQENFDANAERVLGSADARYLGSIQLSRPKATGSAFTLIELIGVIAILALIASMVAPAVIQEMYHASKVRDTAELKAMADSLQSAIRRTGRIPAASDLPAFIANEMGVASSQTTISAQNVQRLFLSDPGLALGTGGLPYDQSLNPGGILNTQPRTRLRFLILSSLSVQLPGTFDFDTAWATLDNSIPSDWTSWEGRGEDLTIQRIDVSPLFHRVILNNLAGTPYPSFSIESGGVTNSASNVQGISDSWYLEKTALCLYGTGNPAPQQLKAILQEDTSYFFESGGSSAYWSSK
jgi:type II secretory pathway pseudopilin PulG